ncbi:MAG: hypothetical protein B6D64_13510 [Bacteroidetes bacterium 4484_276]|nr:MAG: hypothetical protein B6D64_13510 [Bacteroidetes bacterium 4484_276]
METIFDLRGFWKETKESDLRRAGLVSKINKRNVFNPHLMHLFSQPYITAYKSGVSEAVKIPVYPFIESYCKGFDKGRDQFMETYPNPAGMAGDLKIKFDQLQSETDRYPIITSYEGLSKFGKRAGQLSAIYEMIERYPSSLKSLHKTKPATSSKRDIPPLPEIFRSKDYFNTVIDKTSDFWEMDRSTGDYKWIGDKIKLAGLAYQLREMHRLMNPGQYPGFDIYNNQNLRRVFAEFFHIKINEKTFQPNKVIPSNKKIFSFIVDFME